MTQKFRKGDLVSIQAVVETQYDDRDELTSIRNKVSIRVEGQSTMLVSPDQLVLVTPFFAVGERVQTKSSVKEDGSRRMKAGPVRGTVVAHSEDAVWVKFDHGQHGTVAAVDLEPSTEIPALKAVA